jgi:pyruvate formate lyase activating enzyme
MVIGGLQKNSFIDFPGKISCVIFLAGCNFDCPYCHNPDLAKGCSTYPSFLEEKDILAFLESHKTFLDGVVISGGEPTLQKDLMDLCAKIKNMGYPVKIDTNGSRPHVLQRLVAGGLVDYIAMDIKSDPHCYAPAIQKKYNPEPILDSIRILMESRIPYEFRTTCIKPFVNPQIIANIVRVIKGSRLYALQQFRPTTVLNPQFFQENDHQYSDEDLLALKAVAEEWVQTCIVR